MTKIDPSTSEVMNLFGGNDTVGNIKNDKYKLYCIYDLEYSFYQLEILNRGMKKKLIEWDKITHQGNSIEIQKINFIDNKLDEESDEESDEEIVDSKDYESVEVSDKSGNVEKMKNEFIIYNEIKRIKDFFGEKIDIDKVDNMIIDLNDFLYYSNNINDITSKYVELKDIEYEYENNTIILIYNDNTNMSFIDNDIDENTLRLLDNNICGYKKYFEFNKNKLIDIKPLLDLFNKKFFDNEEDFLNNLNMFKKLYKIDDPLKSLVNKFINGKYTITDNNIDDRISEYVLFNKIYKFLGKEDNIILRNKIENYLLEIGLKKTKNKYNCNQWYGLKKTPISSFFSKF